MNQRDMFQHQGELPMAMPAPLPALVVESKRARRPGRATPAPAAAQLDLAVPVLRKPSTGGRPPSVDAAWERAYSLEVRQAFLDEAMKRPGEWIDGSQFYRTVAQAYNIGCCWGHAMGAMARAGMLEVKNHYYGSEFPGPDYKGYNHLYRWHPPMKGEAHA